MIKLRKQALPAAISLALGTAALLPITAQAGFFVGVGVGQSDIDDSALGSGDAEDAVADFLGDINFDALSVDSDDSDTGFKLVAGYRFNDYFALEGQVVDFGEAEVSAAGSGVVVDGGEGGDLPFEFAGGGSQDLKGFGVTAEGAYPLADWVSIFAKLGFFRWDTEVSAAVSVEADDDTVTEDLGSFDDEGIDVNVGVGLRFTFLEHLGVQVEWEEYKIDSTDVGLFSGTVTWEF
jgi:OOP family OmpA-OmpF porin